MDDVYTPLQSNCFIYIDDVLTFNMTMEEHKQHLKKFQELSYKYGLVLSKSKMKLWLSYVKFLGLKIQVRKIIPQDHIAQEIKEFPDELKKEGIFKNFEELLIILLLTSLISFP